MALYKTTAQRSLLASPGVTWSWSLVSPPNTGYYQVYPKQSPYPAHHLQVLPNPCLNYCINFKIMSPHTAISCPTLPSMKPIFLKWKTCDIISSDAQLFAFPRMPSVCLSIFFDFSQVLLWLVSEILLMASCIWTLGLQLVAPFAEGYATFGMWGSAGRNGSLAGEAPLVLTGLSMLLVWLPCACVPLQTF